MRRVWKKHKDSQAKWIKRLPPLRSKEPATPNSDIGSETSSFGSPEPQSRNSVFSSHHLTPRSSVTPSPSADGTEPLLSTQTGDSVDHSIIPIPSGYAHVSPRLAAYVFGSDSDPFGTFPIPVMPRVHEIIHQVPQAKVRTSSYEDDLNTFSSCVGTNAALLYITLSWLAARRGGSSSPENFESSFYLQSSVSAVNQELENADEYGISEGTIAAVACMTNMENLNGERCKAVIHMNGLEQMVNLKGGLYNLSAALRRLILWTDLLYATSWQSTPRFPYIDFSHLPPLSTFLPSSISSPILTFNNCLIHNLIQTGNGTLLPILQDAHELTHFLDIIPPKDITYLNEASYPDRVYSIEHHILELLAQNDIVMDDSPARIVTPLLHSLLLYTYTNLRLTPTGGQIRRTLVGRLRASLEATELTILNCSFAAELMWMLGLGGTAAVLGSEDRKWFKEQLWWVLNRNSALEWSWEQMGGVWRGVLWVERGFLEGCREFWVEALELEWVADL
ncbi:hypothetical protein ONS95_002142 [Cadophora gregata]|nr:uncharacterized protein ONS95_002142 [Cadophora gregata]KAK0109449.1 hypothetical protein ONS95_002142 [Cadophora gregata]KAK0110924.1 hypothetical protein ONS96_002509 [Cadophora gregata f. sp. sojae]